MATVTIALNGRQCEADSALTLWELLGVWGYDLATPLAVAVDENVLSAAELHRQKPAAGSRIEVISLAQGG